MRQSSLRQQLVLPFVLLLVFVSGSIGLISYRAGEQAVEQLTLQVLTDRVDRIATSTERYLSGAVIAVESISPDPATIPRAQAFSDDIASLEERFWAASGLFREVSSFVYFGGVDGRFVGVNRARRSLVELYVREPGASSRSVYAVLAPGERGRLLRRDQYDARMRPWYQLAIGHDGPVWSEVYNDFRTREPIVTLAKAVYHQDRSLAGVLATDITLKSLTDFLHSLTLSRRGVAFVVDRAGLMVATSGEELPFSVIDGTPQRRLASAMQTPLIRQSAALISQWRSRSDSAAKPLTTSFSSEEGRVELAAARLGEKYGIDWVSVVVVPRADFMGGVTRGVFQSIGIALVCVVMTLILGMKILNRLLVDLQKLSRAAQKIGNGERFPQLTIQRNDELGLLAKTFTEMEFNLRTDRLTQVGNREAFLAEVALLQQQAAALPSATMVFGVMFVDLDHFKAVNDQFGHAAGDQVLIVIGARLQRALGADDMVARYGGDEFVLLFKGIRHSRDMVACEQRVRALVEQPISLDQRELTVGLSIGWAIFPRDGDDAHALLKVADARMFGVKNDRRSSH